MKSNKGITLVSLVVYVVVLSAIMGSMAVIQKYFYRNMDETIITNKLADQNSRFIAYLTDDVNSRKDKNKHFTS